MTTVNRIPIDPTLHEYGLAIDRLEVLNAGAIHNRRSSTKEICKNLFGGTFTLGIIHADVLGVSHDTELTIATIALTSLATFFDYRDRRRSGRQAKYHASEAVRLSDIFQVVPPTWAIDQTR